MDGSFFFFPFSFCFILVRGQRRHLVTGCEQTHTHTVPVLLTFGDLEIILGNFNVFFFTLLTALRRREYTEY